MLKFNYIQEFVTLAEMLSFSRAANISYITQPALSRHIAALEEEMGAKLLIRDTRNVVLTEAGNAVYEQFCEMLTSYRKASEKAAALSAGKMGVLKISSPYYWTEDFTEPLIHRFMQMHEGCDLRLISCQPDEGMQEIYEGRSDIFISVDMQPETLNPAIRRVPFAYERLSVVMDVNHPLAGRASLRLEELSGNSFIFLDGATSVYFGKWIENIKSLISSRRIEPLHVYSTQQVDTTGITIRQTGGIALMFYGVRHMDRSYIRVVPLDDEDCVYPMCLYYRMDNQNALIPQLAQVARSNPEVSKA